MTSANTSTKRNFTTRFLRPGDIPALINLEKKQWTDEQQASAQDFQARIRTHPALCGGAFCTDTGELMASLFCKPTTEADWVNPGDWAKSSDLASMGTAGRHRPDCLFGISLTSIDAGAALQLIAFQYLHALKSGYRHVFLGSPMPGLRRYLEKKPGASVETYARMTRSGLPVDPQLRYYHGKGFRQIVAVRENYFPHEASCNYGAILKAQVPFTWLAPVFVLVPTRALRSLAALAPRYAIPETKAPAPHSSSPEAA